MDEKTAAAYETMDDIGPDELTPMGDNYLQSIKELNEGCNKEEKQDA